MLSSVVRTGALHRHAATYSTNAATSHTNVRRHRATTGAVVGAAAGLGVCAMTWMMRSMHIEDSNAHAREYVYPYNAC